VATGGERHKKFWRMKIILKIFTYKYNIMCYTVGCLILGEQGNRGQVSDRVGVNLIKSQCV
jgi:hypothetical protein